MPSREEQGLPEVPEIFECQDLDFVLNPEPGVFFRIQEFVTRPGVTPLAFDFTTRQEIEWFLAGIRQKIGGTGFQGMIGATNIRSGSANVTLTGCRFSPSSGGSTSD